MSDMKVVKNIDAVPTAEVIAQRINAVVSISGIEKEMILSILSAWNDEWVEFIAESKTGVTDSSEEHRQSNADRLKKRMADLNITKTFMHPGVISETI